MILTNDFDYDNMMTDKGGINMFFYSTDCSYIVKVIGVNTHFECYTKEQVMSHIKQPTGTIVYRVLNNGELERIGVIKPYKEN